MATILDSRSDTVVPSEEDSRVAAESSRVLAQSTSSASDKELRVQLDDGQQIVLPKAAARLLSHLLTEMGRGNAVTLIPIHAELTTQEAANVLNVSRPYLIRLLEEDKKIKFHRIGSHRRVKFSDLKRYKDQIEDERKAAMEELAAQAQELKMGY